MGRVCQCQAYSFRKMGTSAPNTSKSVRDRNAHQVKTSRSITNVETRTPYIADAFNAVHLQFYYTIRRGMYDLQSTHIMLHEGLTILNRGGYTLIPLLSNWA